MIFNMVGSGGTKLNFEVTAYATEEELLAATPSNNTVGVITDTAITSWVFSPFEPAEPTEGMVWFELSTKGDVFFEALKKNSIVLCPKVCKQYVNGTYVVRSAHFYNDSNWTQFAHQYFYLYNEGDTCDEITGGWTVSAIKDDHLYIWWDRDDNEVPADTTNNIPTSKYNNIYIEYEVVNVMESGNGSFQWCLLNPEDREMKFGQVLTNGKVSDGRQTLEVDISDVNEDYRLRLRGWYHATKVYRVWLV